jgi:hypothetical protein
MTKDQIIEAAALYLAHLISLGAEPNRMNPSKKFELGSQDAVKDHIAWMCDRLIKIANEGDVEKAGRWLGFIQGVLFMMGEYSIDEFRTHNGVKEVP